MSITIIGAAFGFGAQVRETEMGPEAFQKFLNKKQILHSWKETLAPQQTAAEVSIPVGHACVPTMVETFQRLKESVQDTVQKNIFPTIIGGDHSIAMGTWQGVTEALNGQQKFGLIWIDAHMDSHTPESSQSQAYHGMPVATLLGYGNPELVNLGSKDAAIAPQHLVLMGIRSYESAEKRFLERLNVRVFYIEEIQDRGFKACLDEALQIVSQAPKGFGVSIDLDGFDTQDAPGVGSPEANGLYAEEVLPMLSRIQNHPGFKALELVEYNPSLDKNDKTVELMAWLFQALTPSPKLQSQFFTKSNPISKRKKLKSLARSI
jgi:arginase